MADEMTKTEEQVLRDAEEMQSVEGGGPSFSERLAAASNNLRTETQTVETPSQDFEPRDAQETPAVATPTQEQIKAKAAENMRAINEKLVNSMRPAEPNYTDTNATQTRTSEQNAQISKTKERFGQRYRKGIRVGD